MRAGLLIASLLLWVSALDGAELPEFFYPSSPPRACLPQTISTVQVVDSTLSTLTIVKSVDGEVATTSTADSYSGLAAGTSSDSSTTTKFDTSLVSKVTTTSITTTVSQTPTTTLKPTTTVIDTTLTSGTVVSSSLARRDLEREERSALGSLPTIILNPCGFEGIYQPSCGKCICDDGVYGDSCELKACLSFFPDRACSGHGTCLTEGTCICDAGWTGTQCGNMVCGSDDTDENCCSIGGTAFSSSTKCTCFEGYFGRQCQFQQKNCDNECAHGRCDGLTGQCICDLGYQGPKCLKTSPFYVSNLTPDSVAVGETTEVFIVGTGLIDIGWFFIADKNGGAIQLNVTQQFDNFVGLSIPSFNESFVSTISMFHQLYNSTSYSVTRMFTVKGGPTKLMVTSLPGETWDNSGLLAVQPSFKVLDDQGNPPDPIFFKDLHIEASVSPPPLDLRDPIVTIDAEGNAKFSRLGFTGIREKTYTVTYRAIMFSVVFAELTSNVTVAPCPPFSTTDPASPANCICLAGYQPSGSSCVECPAGLYKDTTDNHACVACPVLSEGGYCNSVGEIKAKKGYWVNEDLVDLCKDNSTDTDCIFPCLTEGSCEAENQCSPGYTGTLCGQCDKGASPPYYRTDDFECRQCKITHKEALAIFVLVLIGICLGTILMVYSSLNTKSKFSIMLKLLINYFQIMALVGDFPLGWPSALAQYIRVSRSVNFDISSFAYSCVWDIDFRTKFIICLCLPVIGLLAPLVIYGLLFTYRKLRGTEVTLLQFRSYYISGLLVINFLIHPVITKYTFKWFSCVDIGTDSFLLADTTIDCHSSTYHAWFAGAIVVAIVYCLGLPLLAFALLFRNRKNLTDPNTMIRYRFLYDGFEEKFYYWELLTVIRKMVFITIIVVFFGDNASRLFTALNVAFIFIILHVLCQPFSSRTIWRLEFAAQAAVFVVLTGGNNIISSPSGSSMVVVDIIVVIVAWLVTASFILSLLVVSVKRLRRYYDQLLRPRLKRNHKGETAMELRVVGDLEQPDEKEKVVDDEAKGTESKQEMRRSLAASLAPPLPPKPRNSKNLNIN